MLKAVEGAIVVHCVLYIEEEDDHAGHFWVRDALSDGVRPMKRYLEALPDIRAIQATILDRAERAGVPAIENSNIERTIAGVMELVLSQVEELERV
jgi:2-phosphoglycerate kinase